MSDMRSLVGNAEAFPILKRLDFFNHAGVAPPAGRRGRRVPALRR